MVRQITGSKGEPQDADLKMENPKKNRSHLKRKPPMKNSQKKIQSCTAPEKAEVRHQWRICSLGQHWVKEHVRHLASGKATTVRAHCQYNSSNLDELPVAEMNEISNTYFTNSIKQPCANMYQFKDRPNVDNFIAGWTQYWNDIFELSVPLEPNVVKALIASESGFRNLEPVKDGFGQGKVRGLMQVTDTTIKILRDKKGELKDHFVEFSNADLMIPNINICVGIRWLFQKRRLAESKRGKNVSWNETIQFYKGYHSKTEAEINKGMKPFRDFFQDLEVCK